MFVILFACLFVLRHQPLQRKGKLPVLCSLSLIGKEPASRSRRRTWRRHPTHFALRAAPPTAVASIGPAPRPHVIGRDEGCGRRNGTDHKPSPWCDARHYINPLTVEAGLYLGDFFFSKAAATLNMQADAAPRLCILAPVWRERVSCAHSCRHCLTLNSRLLSSSLSLCFSFLT